MSKRSERLAAKAKLAAEKAEKEQKALADKLAAAEAAEREEASKSPADKALERAFVKGTLPEEDRRAPDFPLAGIPDGGSLGTPIVEEPPPESPPVLRDVTGTPLGEQIPEGGSEGRLFPQSTEDRDPERPTGSVDTPVAVQETPIVPPVAVAPDMVETPAPLVSLDEVAPLTVENAVAFQNIPNDRIHHVHERADGTKVDALGHVFEPAPKRK